MWDTITQAWHHVTAHTPIPNPWVWAVFAALGVAFVAASPAWKYARHLITIVHEGGHALVGVLCGRKLTAIKLHGDTSGVTETYGAAGGLGVTLTTFAGYPFPAFLAAGLAFGVAHGQARTAFTIVTLLLIVMLLFIRNIRGFATMLVALVVAVGIVWFAPPVVVAAAAALLSGFLTAGAARSILEERAARKAGGETDASALAQRTGIPATVWWAAFLLATAGAAYATISVVLP